jgi:hypothetical protein
VYVAPVLYDDTGIPNVALVLDEAKGLDRVAKSLSLETGLSLTYIIRSSLLLLMKTVPCEGSKLR